MAVTRLSFPVVSLVMLLGVLSPWLVALAADDHGFVVPPDGARRVAGPIGREADIVEILATREQTKGAFGTFRIEMAPQSGPPAHIHRAADN
jgi:hypothetical protein